MPANERFMLLLCAYLSALKTNEQSGPLIFEPALKTVRGKFEPEWNLRDTPEQAAWDYAHFVLGLGPKPWWLTPLKT